VGGIVFIGLWLCGIALSLHIIRSVPKPRLENRKLAILRTEAVVFGFVPLVGIGLVIQLICLNIYKKGLVSEDRNARVLSSRLEAQFSGEEVSSQSASLPEPTAGSDNPFL
jgi:hypothetical protein